MTDTHSAMNAPQWCRAPSHMEVDLYARHECLCCGDPEALAGASAARKWVRSMSLPSIPRSKKVPVLRCDFSDDTRWKETWKLIVAATEDGFQKSVTKIEDRDFTGLDTSAFLELVRQLPKSFPHPLVFFADATTMSDPEHTLFVAWAWKDEYEGQFMRCLPSDVLAIENNVIDNMPWEEFHDAVGDDGVSRTD
ncbi:DUF6924 domain-containing protein [Williamsia maris]|nr:hypothetical protein [Williamsia maris]